MPNGWLGSQSKPGWMGLVNLRLDPFARLGFPPGESWMSFEHYYGREFWRFVFLQEEVFKLAETAIDYPPMQAGASLNLDAVKKQIQAAAAGHSQ
jgi:arylsulfatase